MIQAFFSISLAGNVATVSSIDTPQTPVREDRANVTPKTFEDDFKERYDGSEYVYEEEASDGWFTRLVDWIERKIQEWFDFETRQQASDLVDTIKNIFYVIVIILVVFFIVRAIMNGEGRWVFGKRSDRRIVHYEDVETDIHTTDFNTLIAQAVENTDFRLAIRYQYLNMLKKLSEAEVISYDPEKTNFEYTYEIKNPATREQFQYTSYLYNYVWYGEFDIDKAQYDQAKSSFNVLLKNTAA
jgi:hypothetical protein